MYITKRSIIISADFETTKATLQQHAQVYSWAFVFYSKYDNWKTRHRYLFDRIVVKKLIQEKFVNIKTVGDLTYYYGIRIQDFFTILKSASTSIIVLFQNGSGFDLHFLIPEIEKQGFIKAWQYIDPNLKNQKILLKHYLYKILFFKQLEKRKNKEYLIKVFTSSKLSFEEKVKKFNKLEIGEYRTLIVNHNYYDATICIGKDSKHKNRNIVIHIYDAWLQFNNSLELKGKDIKLPKLSIEYDKITTYKNIQELEQDGNELSYLLRDVEILLLHTLKMYEIIGYPNIEMTAASIAYKQILFIFINNKLKELEQLNKIRKLPIKKQKGKRNRLTWYINDWDLQRKYNSKILTKKSFTKFIMKEELVSTTLNDDEREHMEAKYYRGGICHVNEKYRGIIVPAWGYDINSSYPNVMHSSDMCPIGPQLKTRPSLFNKKYYQFVVFQANLNISIPNCIPFLRNTENRPDFKDVTWDGNYQIASYHVKNSYMQNIQEGDIFYLTSTEYLFLFKQLNITTLSQVKTFFNYEVEFVFKATKFSYFFKYFVEKWYKMKQDKNNKMIAKLFLNSGYGKFCQKLIKEFEFEIQDENNETKRSFLYTKLRVHYLPLGISISAQARINLCKISIDKYDEFIYCDTDSAYFVRPQDHIPQDETKIGFWKNDGIFTHFLVRRGKQYVGINYKTKTGKIKVSGVRFEREFKYHKFSDDLTLEQKHFLYFTHFIGFQKFISGHKLLNQIQGKRFKGGKDIIYHKKEILPTWNKTTCVSGEQTKIIDDDYTVDLKNAYKVDTIYKSRVFRLLSHSNYLKIKYDSNYLDKLDFDLKLTQKTIVS